MRFNELVTIFIPMYNSEEYIKEALESIINQTYTNIEVLIIDDGSTDRSVEIINEFKDERIRLLENEFNRGIPYTRNKGFKNAKGKYIAIMDADDISKKDRIEKQVKYLENNPNIDAISSNIQCLTNSKIKNFIYRIDSILKKGLNEEQVEYSMLFGSPIANPSVMIRKETIENLNLLYDEECFVCQDYNFWVDMILKKCKLVVMKDVLLKYRTGHMNITKSSSLNKKNMRKNIIYNIKDKILRHYKLELTKDERVLFFDFFGEERMEEISNDDVKKIKKIMGKINDSCEKFNEHVVETISRQKVKISLSRSKITLKEKLFYYKEITQKDKVQDKLYIVIRHFINLV